MQIDAYRAVRQPGASRYFRTGHALDQSKNQCFPISIRQAHDCVEDCGGRRILISA